MLVLTVFVPAAKAEMIVEYPLQFTKIFTEKKAYLFGHKDFEEDSSECSSISGVDLYCDSQRSRVSDPVYVGLGVELKSNEIWAFSVEADVDAGLNSSHKLVPEMELTRGLSVKGQLIFNLL